jgi:GNAT superfamily N-acetyltransferase
MPLVMDSMKKGHDLGGVVMPSGLVGVPGLEPGTSSLSVAGVWWTPWRRESGHASTALSRSAWAWRGLGSAPDAISHLRLCAARRRLAMGFRTRVSEFRLGRQLHCCELGIWAHRAFQLPCSVPDAHGLAELTDDQIGVSDERALSLVAEVDGRLVGWLSARLEPPHQNADRQFVREHDWTRLLIDALIVEREQWRRGIGTMLLGAAESWGRAHGAQVARLDTYAQGPVSVPFYEQHMGYQRRSIVFQKQL